MERTKDVIGNFRRFEPDYEMFRREIKALATASDDLIRRHLGDVFEVHQIRHMCYGCKERGGYLACWRDGDGRGNVRVVREVGENYITFANRVCEPRQEHETKQHHNGLLYRAGMTDADRGFTFDNYPSEQAERHKKLFQLAWRFAEEFVPERQEPGLYLFGSPGIGKTHLMLAVCNRLLDRGIEVVFTRADKLVNRLKDALQTPSELERLVAWYSTVPVLAIDEFAQEQISDYGLGKMMEIINDRAQAGLSTWFTSNTLPVQVYESAAKNPDVEKKIDALRSRIMKLTTLAMMRGEDHRATGLLNALEPEW